MMTQVFTSFLLTSLVGTVLALFLVLMRPVTRKCFSVGWHYYMWLVVLLVMLCPVRIALPQRAVLPPETVPAVEQITVAPTESEFVIPTDEAVELPVSPKTQVESTESVGFSYLFLLESFSFVWIFGAVGMLMIKILCYGVFLLKIRKHSVIAECPQLRAYTDRRVTVRLSEDICSPLMLGICRPMLILPNREFSDAQLHHVLTHEVTHLKRLDILYKWFIGFVKCIHWFNPAVYLISHQAGVDCEMACDAAVTGDMDEQGKRDYVNTILALLTRSNRRAVPLTTGMTGGKKTLAKRFSMIKNKLHISKKAVIISAIVAVVVLAGAVLGSGLLNSSLVPAAEDGLLQLVTDARSGDDFNALLLGLDEQGRADTIMMLLCKDGGVTGLSIPRDAVFKVAGGVSLNKISEILTMENGDQKVIDTVKTQFFVPVTYYAKINLNAVRDTIDALGGLEFDVPVGMVYDDPMQDLHINLEPGVRLLSGDEVCDLLRYRGSNDGRAYPRGDLDRVALGQSFIKEFIKQKSTSESLKVLPQVLQKTKDNIKTNYPIKQFLSDIKKLQVAEREIVFTTYTAPGVLKLANGGELEYDLETGDVVAVQSYPSFESNWPENDMAKIKSLTKSQEPYLGFEHIVLGNGTGAQIETILQERGLSSETGTRIDLKQSYAIRPYGKDSVQVQADQNGNISLYLPGYEQNYKVQFYDSVTKEDVGGYQVLGNDTNAYTFLGFTQGKTYEMTVESATGTDWVYSGNYYIY